MCPYGLRLSGCASPWLTMLVVVRAHVFVGSLGNVQFAVILCVGFDWVVGGYLVEWMGQKVRRLAPKVIPCRAPPIQYAKKRHIGWF